MRDRVLAALSVGLLVTALLSACSAPAEKDPTASSSPTARPAPTPHPVLAELRTSIEGVPSVESVGLREPQVNFSNPEEYQIQVVVGEFVEADVLAIAAQVTSAVESYPDARIRALGLQTVYDRKKSSGGAVLLHYPLGMSAETLAAEIHYWFTLNAVSSATSENGSSRILELRLGSPNPQGPLPYSRDISSPGYFDPDWEAMRAVPDPTEGEQHWYFDRRIATEGSLPPPSVVELNDALASVRPAEGEWDVEIYYDTEPEFLSVHIAGEITGPPLTSLSQWPNVVDVVRLAVQTGLPLATVDFWQRPQSADPSTWASAEQTRSPPSPSAMSSCGKRWWHPISSCPKDQDRVAVDNA